MKRLLAIILIICGLAIGFFGIPALIGGAGIDDAVAKLRGGNDDAVRQKLSYIAELSVLDYKYSNAAAYTDQKTIESLRKKVNVPFTKKAVVMTYDGEIKIGTDADKITVEVKKDGGDVSEVTVGLPPMKITSHEIIRDSIDYPLEKNSVFNSLKTEDYERIEAEGRKKMEAEVEKNGTMDRAKEELKKTIGGYLEALYGDDVRVTFKDI